MVILKASNPIFVNGQIIEKGNIFSCSPDFAKKLIENDSASLIEKNNDEVKRLDQLEKMTKNELIELAKEKGIDGINDSNKKTEIIEAILKVTETK